MPRSDRDEQPQVGLRRAIIATAILLVVGGISFGLFEQDRYSDSSAYRAAEYARHSETEVGNACRGIASDHQAICFANARIAGELKKRDNERNEADLVAQRKSALWTMIMGIAALIGMALSAVGVWLVWNTFREAQRTANEAANATAAMIRANELARLQYNAAFKPVLFVEIEGGYLDIQEIAPGQYVADKGLVRVIQIRCGLSIRNYSERVALIKSVAFNSTGLSVVSEPFTVEAECLLQKEQIAHVAKGGFVPEERKTTSVFGYFEMSSANREQLRRDPPELVIVVRYEDSIGTSYELARRFKPKPMGSREYVQSGGKERNYDREVI